MKYFSHLLIVLGLFVAIVGCGKSNLPPDLPKLVPCKITVTQEGSPLENAKVFLQPEDGSKWNATGNTNAQGETVLMTHGMYNGVPEGKYKVLISKTESTNPPLVSTESGLPQEKSKTFTYVEEIYGNASKTPLSIDVSSSNGTHSVDAGKAVKIQLPDR